MHRLSLAAFGLGTALCCLATSQASAQAFPQPVGEGRVITSVIFSQSDKAFDDSGEVIDIADYDKTEVYLLGEYGLTDDLTLLLTPSFRNVSIEAGDDDSGLGYTDVGARYRLVSTGPLTLSVQGLARIPGNTRSDTFAQVGQTDMEYDVRAQAGLAFGGSNFAILEGGYRLRSGDPPNELHVDATVGVRATDKLWLIANSYNTISDGAGQGIFSKHRYHNLYASVAYEVSPRATLQLGALGTVAGRNALRERGVFGGLWLQF